MTRLQRILLAGTMMPALALGPLTSAWSQSPDDQGAGRPHRERPESAPGAHEGGPRGGGNGPAAAERRQERQDRQVGQGAGEGHGPGARAERPNTGEDGGGARRRARQDDDASAPARGAAPNRAADEAPGAGRRRQRENADNAPAPTDRAQPRRAETPESAPAKRAEQPERAPARRAAEDNDAAPNRANRKANAAERDATPETPRRERAGDPDRAPGRERDNAQREERRNAPDRRDNADRGDRARDRDNARRDADRPNDRDNARHDERPRDRDTVRRDDEGPRSGAGVGFLPQEAGARRLDDVRAARRETREGDRVFIREPGRTIVQERGRSFIVHDENDRFRALGLKVQRERRGADFVDTVRRPNGDIIVTTTDPSGRLLRRVRRGPGGRDVVLIDNGVGGARGFADLVVDVPPPPVRIPRNRYIVDYNGADAGLVYDTLIAPPLAPPPRRYTLDQIRYSADLRGYVRQVDVNTINFDTASWVVPQESGGKLEVLASGLKRAIARNPNSVFLIEGYTDATGNPDDNLSLSDRRAQSVAEILTKDFDVPPENLTTQGYGQQNLRENTQGPSAINRRVVVQNITPLLASGAQPDAEGQ